MSDPTSAPTSDTSTDWFAAPVIRSVDAEEIFHVDVAGYEGPLDLLLDLARRQQVDLSAISVLALAEQYLNFIATVRDKRIELAADYLVMAAWLAYLKSRLMVPQAPGDPEPSGEMLAALLQFRLKRLEAMRDAASRLMNRPRLGLTVHRRGDPEPLVIERRRFWEATLYELLKAYGAQREKSVSTDYIPVGRTVWALGDARDILQRLIGDSFDWLPLDGWLADYLVEPGHRATVLASSFSASLELARQGQLELRQHEAFAPLLMRRRKADGAGPE